MIHLKFGPARFGNTCCVVACCPVRAAACPHGAVGKQGRPALNIGRGAAGGEEAMAESSIAFLYLLLLFVHWHAMRIYWSAREQTLAA